MSSHPHSSANELATPSGRQLSLFPLDPWGAENAVAVLERPFPGIARAMLGPLVLGDTQQPMDGKLRCVAVAEGGAVAASVWVNLAHLDLPAALWTAVLEQLNAARQLPTPATSTTWTATPNDCVKAWTDPLFWIPAPSQGDPVPRAVHALSKMLARQTLRAQVLLTRWDLARIETQAQEMVAEQIVCGVHQLLGALYSGLCAVLIARPRLSISVALKLLALASRHSSVAVGYALQALRTESFGLIHLIASGEPEHEAREVREAIFSGRSLPGALSEFGVAKAVHRETIRKPVRAYEPVLRWCDIPIAGQDWLTAMRLASFLPQPSKSNWSEFSRLVELILGLNIQPTETAEDVLKWCIQVNYVNSCDRLAQLLDQARAMCAATKGWTSLDLPLNDAIALAVAMQQAQTRRTMFGGDYPGKIDVGNLYLLALVAAQVSGMPALHILQPLFNFQPGVPTTFQMPDGSTVFALNSIAIAVAHGEDCMSCLADARTVVRYVAEGTALYGVRSDMGAIGTIALRFDCTEESPMVQVQEVRGAKGTGSMFELYHLARHLADACNQPHEVEAWIAHEGECARWRNLATSAV